MRFPAHHDANAVMGVRLPGGPGVYLAIITALGLATGLGVIAYNLHQDRARALALRGRTVLSRPVVVVTNIMAAILLVNTLICAFGKMRYLVCC